MVIPLANEANFNTDIWKICYFAIFKNVQMVYLKKTTQASNDFIVLCLTYFINARTVLFECFFCFNEMTWFLY